MTPPRSVIALLSVLGHVAAGLVIAGLLVWWFQGRLLFYPLGDLNATPADWGLPYEDVQLTAADGTRLHGWFIPAPGAPVQGAPAQATAPASTPRTLLFLHGNAGNISHRGASLAIFHRLGLAVLIIDYRGYGRSEGRPSEAGLYADAAAAWDWLVTARGVAASDIIVFGRSLGAAVAVQLAATRPATDTPAALIAESGFADLSSLARRHFPGFAHVLPLRYRFPAAALIAQVRCPVLVLHSPDDEIVPYDQGHALFAAAQQPKVFVDLVGDHNTGFLQSQPDYAHRLAAFLADLPTNAPTRAD